MVVIDGLLSPLERQQMLDWMTAPQHNHAGPPPEDKWEQACVDRAGTMGGGRERGTGTGR